MKRKRLTFMFASLLRSIALNIRGDLSISNKLDVGCGISPHGSVNCDISIKRTIDRSDGSIIKPLKTANFILCDAQYLPFRSGAFNIVYSSHVIEHVNNPFLMLSELVRVSKGDIYLKCPHRLASVFPHSRKSHHVNFFNCAWFRQAFKVLNCSILSFKVENRVFPLSIIGVNVPFEINMEVRK